jgi:hypothetical protein
MNIFSLFYSNIMSYLSAPLVCRANPVVLRPGDRLAGQCEVTDSTIRIFSGQSESVTISTITEGTPDVTLQTKRSSGNLDTVAQKKIKKTPLQ